MQKNDDPLDDLVRFNKEYEDNTPIKLRNVSIITNILLDLSMVAFFPLINTFYISSPMENYVKGYYTAIALCYMFYFIFQTKLIDGYFYVMSVNNKRLFSNISMSFMLINRCTFLGILAYNFKDIVGKINNFELQGMEKVPGFYTYNWVYLTGIFAISMLLYYILHVKLSDQCTDNPSALETSFYLFFVFYFVLLAFYFSYNIFAWALVVSAFLAIISVFLSTTLTELDTPGYNRIIKELCSYISVAWFFMNILFIIFEFRSMFTLIPA